MMSKSSERNTKLNTISTPNNLYGPLELSRWDLNQNGRSEPVSGGIILGPQK